MSSKTPITCGRAVAVYVDDGQGRRVIVGSIDNGFMRHPVVLALTRQELKAAIAALQSLVEELPPAVQAEPQR